MRPDGMREMASYRHVKGALVSAAKRAIVTWLDKHGGGSAAQIQEAMLAQGVLMPEWLAERPYWMLDKLHRLRAHGHVDRDSSVHPPRWYVPEPSAEEAAPVKRPTPIAQGQVALPRQVNWMHGEVYRPAASAPTRPGAMDYAAIPSRMGSRREPYRSGQ